MWSTQKNLYKIFTPDRTYYLRIAPNLQTEHDNLKRLRPFLSVPEIIGFRTIEGNDYLLMAEIPGKNLCEFIGTWTNEAIAKKFAHAVRDFHALNPQKVFPDKDSQMNTVVLHGDMSLPNIIFTDVGFSGYIDVGKVSIGLAEDDLADAIWSLQRNIGPDYGELFLKEYGLVHRSPKITKALEFRYIP